MEWTIGMISYFIYINLSHSLTHSLSHSLSLSLTHSLTHSLFHSLSHSLTHSLTLSLSHSLTHSLTHSLSHSLTHSRTLSLTHSSFRQDVSNQWPPDDYGVLPDVPQRQTSGLAAGSHPVGESLQPRERRSKSVVRTSSRWSIQDICVCY